VADHVAASMNSLLLLAWVLTLLIWGRTAPARRGHWLFPLAAMASTCWSTSLRAPGCSG
jgi:hypothetical protein